MPGLGSALSPVISKSLGLRELVKAATKNSRLLDGLELRILDGLEVRVLDGLELRVLDGLK